MAQLQAALEAERQGKPKRWFILSENPRSGLKLGIGMFNPGISRIADLFYFGEPSEAIRDTARLIVEAVNACFAVNPKHPRSAAQGYTAIVAACQSVVALEMSDARHDPVVREVIKLVSSALEQARREA
jgi:hypothetical protein